MYRLAYFISMNIKQKLLLAFAAMTLVPILLFSGVIFFSVQNILTESVYSSLSDSANLKIKAISAFYLELQRDITIAQDYFNIKNNLPILIRLRDKEDSPEYILAKKTLDSQMQTLQRVKGFSDMMLTDLSGRIVYSTNPLHREIEAGKNISELGDIFKNFNADKIFISDIFENKVPNKDYNYGILAYGPAKDSNGKLIGGIIFEVNAQSFYNILTEKTGLGVTAETLVGRRISDNEILYLSPLLKSYLPPMQMKVATNNGETATPMKSALSTKTSGQLLTKDYAGDEVIAHWHYLPERDWWLVVKVDTEEAFRDINNLKYFIYTIMLVLSGIIGLAILKISENISGPIKNLQKGVEVVTAGNLNYKVGTDTRDEIGKLSRAFDKMTAELRKSHDELSDKVQEKTAELARKVLELQKTNSFMVDRELKMIELKKEIEELKNKLSGNK